MKYFLIFLGLFGSLAASEVEVSPFGQCGYIGEVAVGGGISVLKRPEYQPKEHKSVGYEFTGSVLTASDIALGSVTGSALFPLRNDICFLKAGAGLGIVVGSGGMVGFAIPVPVFPVGVGFQFEHGFLDVGANIVLIAPVPVVRAGFRF